MSPSRMLCGETKPTSREARSQEPGASKTGLSPQWRRSDMMQAKPKFGFM
eukprot:CAMPEP_0203791038 /NCGR_PEP_ID=MMETSP0100_2-20121128/4394_1 /ASSEMBLY_ACC=CAM_ASM_000210 /TAXON_ID=96639 /ORGANISM=" , Strain NY0313808BC1" /LENGTH=49 /DNA_ID=CAMNT_0050694275 /DNA_START=501 /DNA_END=650 /DNA_ORIENTATION=-